MEPVKALTETEPHGRKKNAAESSSGSYDRFLNFAFFLSILTIGYNLLEGLISVYFGISDETLALLGFGVDSFVEVISGFGVAHMIWRMRRRNCPVQE